MPLGGWPPASNCIEMEITRRASPGQNLPTADEDVFCVDMGCSVFAWMVREAVSAVAAMSPAAVLVRIKNLRRLTCRSVDSRESEVRTIGVPYFAAKPACCRNVRLSSRCQSSAMRPSATR